MYHLNKYNCISGGQPYGITPFENVIKECSEEAGIQKPLARRAKAVGAVSYSNVINQQVKRDVIFCYDLQVRRLYGRALQAFYNQTASLNFSYSLYTGPFEMQY